MSFQLPSLRAFQPKFYTGGPSRFYLPLFYDLVALRKPARIATVWLGDGQAHFTFCQAIEEQGSNAICVAVPRVGEEVAEAAQPKMAVVCRSADEIEAEIDLLLIDDCDSGTEFRELLGVLSPRLSSSALVLLHGTCLEREDSPRVAWQEWTGSRRMVLFDAGIGLGLTNADGSPFDLPNLASIYRVVAERIDAQARADRLGRQNAVLRSQRVWLDSLFEDRMEAQRVMDSQAQEITDLESWRRERAKGQLVMASQAEQLENLAAITDKLVADKAKLKAKVEDQKRILNAAKLACRKGGKCFHLADPDKPKTRRSVGARIARELQRVPRNLRNLVSRPPAEAAGAAPPPVKSRYETWIENHEKPDRFSLDPANAFRPKISLLLPVLNPPAEFLRAMLESILAQTYKNWELCILDAGSENAIRQQLELQKKRDARIKLERLEQNLGIAANTNRAFAVATGDFIACIDHDDVLAPFALTAIARAIQADPEAEIFYSDEDRLTNDGRRHSPFFKPDWSPELLLSSMYLGHLTLYQRGLVEKLGGWRTDYELSQDYDLALRATDGPRRVVHVPHVLYHWREHPGSAAAGGKPQARKTNLAALADAMRRRQLEAEVVEYEAANRARLKLAESPRVSIIIPTDSSTRARRCVEHLPAMTNFPNYEIILVTNSNLAGTIEMMLPAPSPVRCVRFDQPFNFSEKCNAGAAIASGERLIFFNDDVEVEEPDWIETLIEPLENPEIGAVSPKLLYATRKIQHAGLVTGVRGVVGTAFHQQAADTTINWSLAQKLRDVSALSGACLALRRSDFERLGGWDAVQTPIANSDLDLCFKIRAAGMRCVYTPFTTLHHAGHESIRPTENAEDATRPRDKSLIYLLHRWGGYATRDPYFTESMRELFYLDSPTPIWMSGRNQPGHGSKTADLLFVSHDLSWSGAPLILLHVAQWCIARGYSITLMSPKDGPLREKFADAGVPVIVDPLITTGHESFPNFARNFDCLIASTIFSGPVITAAKKAGIPHFWWIHEGQVAQHFVATDRAIRKAFSMADNIVTPDLRSSRVYQPYAETRIRILPYGIPEPQPRDQSSISRERLTFLMIGTIEQRKGQRVLLEALRQLPRELLERTEFRIVGRTHEPEIADEIRQAASNWPWLKLRDGSVSAAEAVDLIAAADVILSASSDETGPLVLMEGAALGKVLLSTNVGYVGEVLRDEVDALFFRVGDATALASRLERLIREPELVRRLSDAARQSYQQHFTFDRFASGFFDLVSEISARQV